MTITSVHPFYETNGHREYCLSFGAVEATRNILIVPPLFDEMNRTRRMLVEAMRALAGNGVRTLLPDLPGCNESKADLSRQTLASWREAVSDCAAQAGATHIASVRGGCLIDDGSALPLWRLAPVKGASLLRTMLRTRIAADKEAGVISNSEQLLASAMTAPIELSGNLLSADMLASLETADAGTGGQITEATLAEVGGTALWLRAEPGDDPAMSVGIAFHLERWSASCGG